MHPPGKRRMRRFHSVGGTGWFGACAEPLKDAASRVDTNTVGRLDEWPQAIAAMAKTSNTGSRVPIGADSS